MDFLCLKDNCSSVLVERVKPKVFKNESSCTSAACSTNEAIGAPSPRCVKKKVDSNYYFHALDVHYTDVPSCTVKKDVLHGYALPYMPRRYYLKTLWMPNNETFNVWTHLGPGLYFLWMLYKYSEHINLQTEWPILVTIIAAITVTFCSALAHMFHSRSELDHCSWLLFDFFGIIAYSYGSTVSHFFACTELSYYSRIGYWNLAILTFHCCMVYYFLCITKIPNSVSATTFGTIIRISGLAYGYIYGILPIICRCLRSDWESRSMRYHIISMSFMLISPYIYACKKPQCYKPGTFDIIGHNHQIFHLSTALMIYFDILAVYQDVTIPDGHWAKLKQQPDHPSLFEVCVFALIVVVWCFAVRNYVMRIVRKLLSEENPAKSIDKICTFDSNKLKYN